MREDITMVDEYKQDCPHQDAYEQELKNKIHVPYS